jgi:hypothetical protein
MGRTSGKSAWEKYYKNNDGISVEVKKSSPYYANETTSKVEGNLQIRTSVIYRDVFSQHISRGGNTKIAFQFNESGSVYYSPVDNFKKPGRVGNIDLKPEAFGIENETFNNSSSYYQRVIDSIADRWSTSDYSGELYDYLMELVAYANGGSGDFAGIKTEGFDWGAIQSYFAEVIGPLACIKKGVLSDLQITNLQSAKIFMPPSSISLYDYKLIVGNQEYLISAKSGKGVSNQVKPQLMLPYVENTLSATLKSSQAYNLLKILGDYSVKTGAFLGWQLLQNTVELTPAAIADVAVNYEPRNKKSSDQIINVQPWAPFLTKYFPNSRAVTYGQVRYKCETLIQTASRTGTLQTNLKKIFQEYLNNSRIIYVKMSVSMPDGRPTFSRINDNGVKSVNYLELRSSNDSQNRTSDRIGFDMVR